MKQSRIYNQGVLSRRHFLQGAGAGGALFLGVFSALPTASVQAATPRPGGIARVRGYDPLGWDAMLSTSYRTHIAVSYTHNRLFRYKPGADVSIGKMIIEPDLVERWEEPSDTRYILHLRQGVHFHDKPPVGGRELVAEMLAAYEPKVKSIFTKNPKYFRTGLPYIDEVQFIVLDDDSTASAAYMSGQLDFGWGFVNTIRLEELAEFKTRHPEWHYEQFLWNVSSYIYMHTDQPPFNDQRVRQAISMAINRQEMIDTIGMGQSKMNTAVPAALRDWHVPVDQLGDGARYYQYNPDEAKRLLKDAGHPRGFKTSMLVHTGYSSIWADIIDLVANYLREVGIDVQIQNKEYGAYIKALVGRDYEGMMLALYTPSVIPDSFVHGRYVPDHPANSSFVNDPDMERLARAQRREKDVTKRKAIIDELSRKAAVNQYYVHFTSGVQVASWPPYVQNFNTNLGYDYGARLEAAWMAKA
jgi:peptide/nickel transport system substrate-binding protein